MPLQLLTAPAMISILVLAALERGPSPPAPAPPPGVWGKENNLTFCNGKALKIVNTQIPLTECKAMCASDPQCYFINHAETDPGQCQTLATCTGTACKPAPRGGDPGNNWWSVYAYGRAGAPSYPGCKAPPPHPGT